MAPPPNYHEAATQLHEYIMSQDPARYHNNPQALLDAIEHFDHNIERIMVYPQAKLNATEKVLAKMDSPPKVLVELGGYVGMSAVAWGAMLRQLNSKHLINAGKEAKPKVFSCELEPSFCTIINDFVSTTGLSSTVSVLQGQSGDSLQKLKETQGIEHIDVLFIDHWEKFYLPDLRLCEELGLLKKGSVIVADNVDRSGAPEYRKYIESGGEGGWKYKFERLDVDVENGPRLVHVAWIEGTP